MNTGLQSLVGGWFRREDNEMPHELDIPPLPPPTASMLPVARPVPTDDERRLQVIADAHRYVEQIKEERIASAQMIDQLQAEVGNLTHALQSELRKSGLLELDIVQRDNVIATLQAEVIEHKRLLDLLRDINAKSTAAFDRLNIKGTKKEPKEHKPKIKHPKKALADGSMPGDGKESLT